MKIGHADDVQRVQAAQVQYLRGQASSEGEKEEAMKVMKGEVLLAEDEDGLQEVDHLEERQSD